MSNVKDATRKPGGFGSSSAIAAASNLPALGVTSADGSDRQRVALIQAEGADLYWRDDGTDPVDAVGGGMKIVSDATFLYVGDITAVRVIGTGTINVSYYG